MTDANPVRVFVVGIIHRLELKPGRNTTMSSLYTELELDLVREIDHMSMAKLLNMADPSPGTFMPVLQDPVLKVCPGIIPDRLLSVKRTDAGHPVCTTCPTKSVANP